MSKLDINVKNNRIIWDYEDWHYIGLLFNPRENYLEEAGKYLKREDFEVSDIISDERSYFQAMRFNPFIEYMIDCGFEGPGFMTAYGVNRCAVDTSIEETIAETKLKVMPLTKSFINLLESGLPIFITNYEQAKETAKETGKSVETTLSAINYADFLINHKGLSNNESIRISFQKFGIPTF